VAFKAESDVFPVRRNRRIPEPERRALPSQWLGLKMIGEEDRDGQSADSKELADITTVLVNKVRSIGQGRTHFSNYTSGLGKVASFAKRKRRQRRRIAVHSEY
jgi:hypothetical protein